MSQEWEMAARIAQQIRRDLGPNYQLTVKIPHGPECTGKHDLASDGTFSCERDFGERPTWQEPA